MKTFIFIILSVLWFQNKFEAISIANISDSYSRKDTCKIILSNNTEQLFYYYFSVEQYDSVLFWREVSGHIDGSTSKLTLLSELKGGETKIELFVIKKVIDDYHLFPGEYRLGLNYFEDPNKDGKVIYSAPFKVY